MVKFAVIGTGWIVEEFVKGCKLVDGLEFWAVYSRSYEKGMAFAKAFGADKVFTNLDELAKSDVDAVYIASPNSLHYSQSKLMLQSGKHVLCEKPATVLPEEFEELLSLAQSKNLIYSEAIMYLHLPARKLLKSAVLNLGDVTTAHFDFSQLSSKYEALKNGELPNIFNPKFATGALMDLGLYCVYPAIDLFGEPEEIFSKAGFLSTGADGFGSTIFSYKAMQATLTYSKIGQSRGFSQIIGSEGTLTTPSISKLVDLKLFDNNGSEQLLNACEEKHILMSYEARDFYKWITKSKAEYDYKECNEIILNVNKNLEKIRRLSGIKFG